MASVVIFRCNGNLCALEGRSVRCVAPMPNLSLPPTAPPILAGFAIIGGASVPVLRTDLLLGLRSEADADPFYRHLLVLEAEGLPLALEVERVVDVRDVTIESLTPIADDMTLNGCVAGDFASGGNLVHLLTAERILRAEERARVEALLAVEQARDEAWGAP
jgi:purine-binding chemotaxis protein CheW